LSLHVLGQKVAAVAGGVHEQIGGRRSDGSVQNRFQCLVGRLAIFKTQVITKDDKSFRPVSHHLDDIRKVGQVRLVNLDQTQALRGVGIQDGLDQG
jgi:hypothetical protein